MIWLTFLGAGLVLRYGGHIGIDSLQNAFPRHGMAIRVAIYALLLLFFGTMLWLGLRYAILAWGQTTPVMQIPIGAVYLAIPLGFGLLIVHLALMTIPYLRQGQFLADAEFDADAAKL
jgi:TRAP-type C4-dicarboxylate transport system permease small subunit